MTNHARLAEAHAIINDILSRCQQILLAFSGGKESVVLAHMLQPWRDRVTLVWVNTGDGPIGMADYVRGYRAKFNFVELSSDPRSTWARFGPPADVVPTEAARPCTPGPKLQPWSTCCWRNRNEPLLLYVRDAGALLRDRGLRSAHLCGQRRDDYAYSREEARDQLPYPEPAWPLWDWIEADVMSYVDANGLRLPPHYAEVIDSMDCMSCPADLTADRLRYLDRHFPDLAAEVRRTSAAAREIGRAALDAVESALTV